MNGPRNFHLPVVIPSWYDHFFIFIHRYFFVIKVVDEIADLQSFMSTSIGTLNSDAELEEELQELLDASPAESSKDEARSRPELPDISNLPDLGNDLSALNLEGN